MGVTGWQLTKLQFSDLEASLNARQGGVAAETKQCCCHSDVMRVFAGIFPPDSVFEDLDRVLRPMLELRPDLDWVPAPLWHVTLTFFGNVTLQDVSTLNSAVHRVCEESPAPRLRLAGAGTYPESAAAQEMFVAVNNVQGKLVDLRDRLVTSVRDHGWMLDRREFRQHLAIARSHPHSDVKDVLTLLSDYQGPEWSIPSIAVIWTRQSGFGLPKYDLLGEHHFRPIEGVQ